MCKHELFSIVGRKLMCFEIKWTEVTFPRRCAPVQKATSKDKPGAEISLTSAFAFISIEHADSGKIELRRKSTMA